MIRARTHAPCIAKLDGRIRNPNPAAQSAPSSGAGILGNFGRRPKLAARPLPPSPVGYQRRGIIRRAIMFGAVASVLRYEATLGRSNDYGVSDWALRIDGF